MENPKELIEQLKKFDNPKGYKLSYQKVKKELQPVIDQIVALGDISLDGLHSLVEQEATWSCIFALQALQQIKSVKSILPLANFIRRTDDSSYWEIGEDAMKALTAIGRPAVPALIEEVRKDFQDKKHYTYLMSALTEIPEKEVGNFMVEILQDYIQNYKKYDEWFELVPFVLDFDKHDSRDSLPALEKLYHMDHLSKEEKREIEDTIDVLKDPVGHEKKMKEMVEAMKKEFPELTNDVRKIFDSKKKEIDSEDFFERASEADEAFEANFKCQECGERQNHRTGQMWDADGTIAYEQEIMCKKCRSHEMDLTKEGQRGINKKRMRIIWGKEGGILPIGKMTLVENKEMPFKKAYDYVLKRIKEEPDNAELYLRAGNAACKKNRYPEALESFEKSMALDPSLIANYINVAQIYAYRASYYGLEEYAPKAREAFKGFLTLLNSYKYNTATIKDPDDLPALAYQLGKELGFEMKREKVGRNDPCPCGSEKKFKKCCLEE